jgi:tRNA dimethylallyltransferase
MSQRPDLWIQRTCEFCNVITTNQPEWESHVGNSKHKKRVARAKKRIEIEAFLKERRRKEETLQEQEGDNTAENRKET